MRRIVFIICVSFGLLLTSNSAFSAKHALLIGISNYDAKPLSGPVHDVNAIKKALVRRWGFQPDNVVSLLNEEATRENILLEVEKLYDRSAEDEEIFVYFSGHGTSGNDRELNIPLPTESGAFIPYDIDGLKSTDDLLKKLIIGRRDLQPAFKKLDDGGRHVFVAMDACYSGNSVRGQYADLQLPSRFMKVEDILPHRGFGDDLSQSGGSWSSATTDTDKVTYPYRNIYYLAASGEHEPAQDIPPKMLNIYPTINGKPHGAFTDTLLRVLNREIDADVDQNGKISYRELKTSVRTLMRIRGFNHTPQGLPSLAEDKLNLASRGIFGSDGNASMILASKQLVEAESVVGGPDTSQAFRVQWDGGNRSLAGKIGRVEQVMLVDGNADLTVKESEKGWLLLSSGGDLVTHVRGEEKKLIDVIRRQAIAHHWINQASANDFSLELDLFGTGKGGTATDGEQLGFSIRSSETAYLLLLDVDPFGKVTVLYPYLPGELAPLTAATTKDLAGITQVREPYGRDLILAYAFTKLHPEMEKLRAKSFYIDSEEMKYLEGLLSKETMKKSSVNLSLITAGD